MSSDQLDFWAQPVARTSNPTTSHQAAHSVDVFRARRIHNEILDYLAAFAGNDDKCTHGAVGHEWSRYPHRHILSSPSGLRTRLSELRDAGLVRDSGRRAKISTGRKAIVWTLT